MSKVTVASQAERWRQDVRKMSSSASIRRELSLLFGAQVTAEIFRDAISGDVDILAGAMAHYAHSWKEVSDVHRSDGVYSKVIEFAKIRPSDLVLDVGCGCGNLLAELGRGRVIGVDINPFSLGLAEEEISRLVETRNYPWTSLEFNRQRGFVVTPQRIVEKLKLDHANLIADDIVKLDNAGRVLEAERADVIVLMLTGGHSESRRLEFIDHVLRRSSGRIVNDQETTPFYPIDCVIKNIRKIAKAGTRLIIGMRGIPVEDNEDEPECRVIGGEQPQTISDRYAGVLKVVSQSFDIRLQREDVIGNILIGKKSADGLTAELIERMRTEQYILHLTEAVIL